MLGDDTEFPHLDGGCQQVNEVPPSPLRVEIGFREAPPPLSYKP